MSKLNYFNLEFPLTSRANEPDRFIQNDFFLEERKERKTKNFVNMQKIHTFTEFSVFFYTIIVLKVSVQPTAPIC